MFSIKAGSDLMSWNASGVTQSSFSTFNLLNVRFAGHIREFDITSPAFAAPQSAKRKQRAAEAQFSPDTGLSVPRKRVRCCSWKVRNYMTSGFQADVRPCERAENA